MKDAVNQWKDELDKAATNYAGNHKDSEVRRMFGHHYRSFVDGAIWENDRKSERIKSLEEAGSNLLQAMNQYSFFLEGYAAGSASISECNHANDELNKAQNVLFELLKTQ